MSDLGQKLIDIVRVKADENPDFFYQPPNIGIGDGGTEPACVYVYEGCPSCILGHALLEAGVIDPSFEETPHNGTYFIGVVDALALEELSGSEVQWLRTVQRYQDSKKFSWGQAVERADRDSARPIWNVA